MELAQGLTIAAVSGREDPRDVLVTMRGHRIRPESVVRIGTSSPRRQLQARLMCKNTVAGGCRGQNAALSGEMFTPGSGNWKRRTLTVSSWRLPD